MLLLLACCAGGAGSGAAAATPPPQGEPCRLERAVAPDYGGVMLGMTTEELARMFPGSDELQRVAAEAATAGAGKQAVASLGMLELGVRREQFADVGELLLTFLGGRLHRVDVRYRQPVPWRDAAEFSENASKRLAVPADAWGAVASDSDKLSRVLDCRGFSVVVRIDRAGPNTLSIVDTSAAQVAPAAATTTQPADAAPRPAKRRPRKGQSGGGGSRPAPAPGGKEKPLEKEGQQD